MESRIRGGSETKIKSACETFTTVVALALYWMEISLFEKQTES